MNKLIAVALVMMLLLSGCSYIPLSDFLQEDVNAVAENTFSLLVEAANNQDVKVLGSLFSDSAQEAINDFDAELENFLMYIDGTIQSYTSDNCTASSSKTTHGKKAKIISSYFSMVTSEAEYYVSVVECTVDNFDDKNVGVKAIAIINKQDWPYEYRFGISTQTEAGIYISNNN